MKILMILTSHDTLGTTGRKTGFWLEEFAAPYYVFKDAGAEITLASPKGGQPPFDPRSDEPAAQTGATGRFKADPAAQAELATTRPLSELKAKDFDAVFYPGGHGPLWDLAEDASSRRLIETMLAAGKPVAAICHAPAVFRHAESADGMPLVQGKNVTGFSDTEEAAAGLTDVVPFLIEFPPYRAPSLHSLYVTVVNRTKDFLTTAGTVILAFSIALWILTELPRTNVGSTNGNTAALRLETERTQLDSSYAASIGRAVQPVFAPLGFDWRITLGVLGSYAARETFVSVMGQVYAADVSASDVPLREVIHRELPLPVGLSLLAYYVYALQCVSTMAVMKRETGTWKWPALSFAITFVLAYAAAWLTFIIASS